MIAELQCDFHFEASQIIDLVVFDMTSVTGQTGKY